LQLPERPEAAGSMNVLLGTNDGLVSLVVDAVEDVMVISPEQIQPPPETMSGFARAIVRRACQLRDRLLLILDPDKALKLTAVSNQRDEDTIGKQLAEPLSTPQPSRPG